MMAPQPCGSRFQSCVGSLRVRPLVQDLVRDEAAHQPDRPQIPGAHAPFGFDVGVDVPRVLGRRERKASLGGHRNQFLRLLLGDRQRLFEAHVFPGVQGFEANRVMQGMRE